MAIDWTNHEAVYISYWTQIVNVWTKFRFLISFVRDIEISTLKYIASYA